MPESKQPAPQAAEQTSPPAEKPGQQAKPQATSQQGSPVPAQAGGQPPAGPRGPDQGFGGDKPPLNLPRPMEPPMVMRPGGDRPTEGAEGAEEDAVARGERGPVPAPTGPTGPPDF